MNWVKYPAEAFVKKVTITAGDLEVTHKKCNTCKSLYVSDDAQIGLVNGCCPCRRLSAPLKLEEFQKLAVELILQEGVSQTQLIDAIRQALMKEAAGLPPVQVLYNCIYGGISYSDEFTSFLKTCEEVETEGDVPLIKKFGSECSHVLLNEDADSDLEVGLVCASGQHCRLKVAEVPTLLEWEIDEYDGKETVRLV